jgi:hypothetical protein
VRAKSGPHDNVQQHSGDWTMTGKVPVARAGSQELPATIGRMDAILNARARILEDSAGSPDADFADVADSVSPSCTRLPDFWLLHFGRRVVS